MKIEPDQIHNFNAGPSVLASSVKAKIHEAIISIKGGPGILELSHRSSIFEKILTAAKQEIAKAYQLPDTHNILFLQGGASLQFAMLAFNLGTNGGFINTGVWSQRAFAEALKLTEYQSTRPVELWQGGDNDFRQVPKEITLPQSVALNYLHLTSNNTIYGTQYRHLPAVLIPDSEKVKNFGNTPGWTIDASSDLFAKQIDWSKVDLLYGGAQKNAGPAGVTLVIGRKDLLLEKAKHPFCPKILEYRTHTEKDSLYHTPNTLGIFAVGQVAKWVNDQGGIAFMQSRAQKRSQMIYDIIDYHDVYQGHASPQSRSTMNITFRGKNKNLESKFLEKAKALNMFGLKGHRSVGGLRASLYNAITDESVSILCQLLETMAKERT